MLEHPAGPTLEPGLELAWYTEGGKCPFKAISSSQVDNPLLWDKHLFFLLKEKEPPGSAESFLLLLVHAPSMVSASLAFSDPTEETTGSEHPTGPEAAHLAKSLTVQHQPGLGARGLDQSGRAAS